MAETNETSKAIEGTANPTDGGESETDKAAKELDSKIERLEAANKKAEEINRESKRLQVLRDVGGETGAQETKKKKTDDDKWAEGAKERYAGTGLDPTPDDTPTTYS